MAEQKRQQQGEALFGISEICQYLGCGERRFRDLLNDSAFPVARRGSSWVSNRRALDEWSYQAARNRRR